MTIRTLSAIAILSAALVSPVLAQDARVRGPVHEGAAYRLRHFRGAYNQAPLDAPYGTGLSAPRVFTGDGSQAHSFPGGGDPSFNPPGN